MSNKKKLEDLREKAFAIIIVLAIIAFVPGVDSFLVYIVGRMASGHPLSFIVGVTLGSAFAVYVEYSIWKIIKKNKMRKGECNHENNSTRCS